MMGTLTDIKKNIAHFSELQTQFKALMASLVDYTKRGGQLGPDEWAKIWDLRDALVAAAEELKKDGDGKDPAKAAALEALAGQIPERQGPPATGG
jgi:hypothetical protein